MEKRKRFSQILVKFCLLGSGIFGSSTGLAQDSGSDEWKYKTEVFGGAGHGRFLHGDNNLGSGVDLGGGFALRPFSGALHGLGFEIMFNGLGFNQSWSQGYSYNGKMHAITGNILYHFGRSRTQFYFVGGLGGLQADYAFINPYTRDLVDDPHYTEISKGTKIAINLGAGVKYRIISGLALRPEFRMFDTTMGKGYNWTYLRLSIALGYHF